MGEEEAIEEQPPLDEAELLFGRREEDLSEEDREKLKQQREWWDAEDRINCQIEHDEQIALQLQAGEQQRADRPVQLGPARRTVALPTEAEVAHARDAFGNIDLGGDEQIVAPPMQREERPAKEAYQPPPCEIRVFKPSTHTLEHLTPTPEEEAQLAKQAFKP